MKLRDQLENSLKYCQSLRLIKKKKNSSKNVKV